MEPEDSPVPLFKAWVRIVVNRPGEIMNSRVAEICVADRD